MPNNLKEIRTKAVLSKAVLPGKADVTVLTISRIECGRDCQRGTKWKIIQTLGLKFAEEGKVFQ